MKKGGYTVSNLTERGLYSTSELCCRSQSERWTATRRARPRGLEEVREGKWDEWEGGLILEMIQRLNRRGIWQLRWRHYGRYCKAKTKNCSKVFLAEGLEAAAERLKWLWNSYLWNFDWKITKEILGTTETQSDKNNFHSFLCSGGRNGEPMIFVFHMV